jgi:hypothetical protein
MLLPNYAVRGEIDSKPASDNHHRRRAPAGNAASSSAENRDAQMKAYNHRFAKQVDDSQNLFERCWQNIRIAWREILAVNTLPTLQRALVLLGFLFQLLYLLSPFDLISEASFGTTQRHVIVIDSRDEL